MDSGESTSLRGCFVISSGWSLVDVVPRVRIVASFLAVYHVLVCFVIEIGLSLIWYSKR